MNPSSARRTVISVLLKPLAQTGQLGLYAAIRHPTMARAMGISRLASDDVTVASALKEHYAIHGLPADGGANDPWFRVRLGPVRLRLPNPPTRRRAVLFHDVNHIATGYNTTFSQGEVAIAAFEVGAGCGRFATVWLINLWGMALGLFCAPRAVFDAFVRGRRSMSIYREPPARDSFASTTVGEVRRRLGLAAASATSAGSFDYLSFVLWSLVALTSLVVPAILTGAALWSGLRALARGMGGGI
jgi:hypothetical protein